LGEYADNIYVYEEVQGYLENPPKRKMKKYEYMKKLEGMERDEVNELIEKRLKYINEGDQGLGYSLRGRGI